MKLRMVGLAALAAVVTLAGVATTQVSPASAAPCTYVVPSGFFAGKTAAIGNPVVPVTGNVDATGCDIGVYYGGGTGTVSNANVFGALWYGVVVDGDTVAASVDVVNSSVHHIGDVPFNGVQRGLAIYYRARGTATATGNVTGNTVSQYQKGGIIVDGAAAASILNNSVAGLGAVNFIAQNGIQISRGASAEIRGNTVGGNDYTPKDWVSCGILYFAAGGVKASQNKMQDNEMNFCNFGEKGGGQYNPNP